MNSSREILSVVVPAFNEAEVLEEFWRRLARVLESIDLDAEVVFVNDGSEDKTLEIMYSLRNSDRRIAVVDLSRNFGKEIALTAGLDYATGDAVVVMDADLQDPPELISSLIAQWRLGYEVVYAKRIAREGETFIKKFTARMFYRVIHNVSRVKIPQDTGDFRLLSRRAVLALRGLREQHRFMKGLFAWIGYSQIEVPYKRDGRYAGETKWSYWRLWNFALEGITSFTTVPLKVATYVGLVIAFLAFLFAGFIMFKTIAYGDPVRGYPSLMVAVLLLGGIQLTFIGILGEYLGRMFDETKARPLYLLRQYCPAELHNTISEKDLIEQQGKS